MEASLVSAAMQKALFPKADEGGESKMYEAAVKKHNRYNIPKKPQNPKTPKPRYIEKIIIINIYLD